jgi:dihydrofolate reductase
MISIIVAVAKNGVIGNQGDIPWHLSDDLKHFAKVTKGHTVIMGRKTYESIVKRLGHALPNRQNIIITSQANYSAPGCLVTGSVQEALSKLPLNDETFVIGGGEIYKQFLPLADKLYVTDVLTTVEGDAYFPPINDKDWEEVARETHLLEDEKNSHPFTFLELVRK